MFFQRRYRFIWLALAALFLSGSVGDILAQSDWKKEWERTLQEAKKEGKIVVGISARAELRKELETVFKPQFGVDMELLTARGSQHASRIASEYKAGVEYFDAFIGGSGAYQSLVYDGIVEPLAPNLILPEVREEKYWWGGHIWEDKDETKRFLYSFIADAGAGGYLVQHEVAKEGASLPKRVPQSQVERQNRLSRPRTLAQANPSGLFFGTLKEKDICENSSSRIFSSAEISASSPMRWQKANSRLPWV